jgi:hypothetical protein
VEKIENPPISIPETNPSIMLFQQGTLPLIVFAPNKEYGY